MQFENKFCAECGKLLLEIRKITFIDENEIPVHEGLIRTCECGAKYGFDEDNVNLKEYNNLVMRMN
jgi:hypothetical protein